MCAGAATFYQSAGHERMKIMQTMCNSELKKIIRKKNVFKDKKFIIIRKKKMKEKKYWWFKNFKNIKKWKKKAKQNKKWKF